MSLRVRAVYRIAVHLLTHAELLFCRDLQHLRLISFSTEQFKRLTRDRSRNRLRGQVKDLIPKLFPCRLHCRKNGGNRFPYSCRRLNEQIFPPRDRAVNPCGQIMLSPAVRKRKFQFPNRFLPQHPPCELKIRPLFIFRDQFRKPLFKCLKGEMLSEIFHLHRIQIAVGHLYINLLQIMLQRVDISITHRLCPMYSYRLLQQLRFHIHALDLIDHNPHSVPDCNPVIIVRKRSSFSRPLIILTRLNKNPVRPSLNHKLVVLFLDRDPERNLRMILRPHTLLNLPVDPAALLHRIRGRDSASPIVDIAFPQNKFHKIPNRDADDSFFILYDLISHPAPPLFPYRRTS